MAVTYLVYWQSYLIEWLELRKYCQYDILDRNDIVMKYKGHFIIIMRRKTTYEMIELYETCTRHVFKTLNNLAQYMFEMVGIDEGVKARSSRKTVEYKKIRKER